MGMMGPGSGPPMIHWWLGRRKQADSGPANSGLTGDAEPELPPVQEGPKDLRGRWLNFKQSVTGTTAALPRVLRLVWDASPATTLALFITTAIAGVIPAAAAFTAKLLTNAVVQGIGIHNFHQPDHLSLTSIGGPGSLLFWQQPVLSAVQWIVLLAVLQLALFAITALLGTLRNITQQMLQNDVSMRIQLMVMEKAASLDLAFYEDPASYDLLRRAQTDSINRPVMMISTAFGLVQTLLTFVTMVAVLLVVSPLLALLALVTPIPAFIADTRYGWRGYNIARWGSRLLRRMNYLVTLVTTDSYAKEVKLFGLGGYFIDRYRLIAKAYYGTQRAQVARRYMTGFAWGNLSTIATSLTYLYVLMETKPSMQPSPATVKVPEPMHGEIRFDNVTFAYPGAEANALTDLSFTVKPGETLAIVGRNGAGKTTLFKLICRLYDPNAGRILIDGIDIKDFDPNELRAQIGAMFQDYVTYQATAAENIGLGNVQDINDRERIEVAGAQAGAAELISGLPEGYDTALGKWFDHGVNLSGGEWQKVALARAFMRDAKIRLLDEPTSALDAQAEYDLFERLRSLTRGRTAVYISHRFSTVRRADRIVFLERGRDLRQLRRHAQPDRRLRCPLGHAEHAAQEHRVQRPCVPLTRQPRHLFADRIAERGRLPSDARVGRRRNGGGLRGGAGEAVRAARRRIRRAVHRDQPAVRGEQSRPSRLQPRRTPGAPVDLGAGEGA